METLSASVDRKILETVTIRFAGDSGDGMQLTGTQFTNTSAFLGNDVNTFPDFPAEIRAPIGTLAGVSGFQVSFSQKDIHTPGDDLDTLVVMNPAALKSNLADLRKGGFLIVNSDAFDENDLKKAGYAENPLENDSLNAYQVFKIGITNLTVKSVEPSGVSKREGERCKNFFALGVVFWLYDRPMEHTLDWISSKFGKNPQILQANQLSLKAGYNYAITAELFGSHYRVLKATLPPGIYKQITGNEAAALACVAAASLSKRPFLLSGYPITPASDIIHYLAKYQNFGIRTFQAEDEIAAVCAAVGAAFGGSLAITSTSGPGLDLKSEGIGLAVMVELPLVIAVVQRGGPSTGLPTKTEQSDLLHALYGRHGECPLPVVAAATPSDCFFMLLEAFRIALTYMTPVIFLSDGYLANGAEPWKLPDVDQLPSLEPKFHTNPDQFTPYTRDPETLGRLWAIPGTPGLEHRIGGLEKDSVTGNISYDTHNHQRMTDIRAEKIERVANSLPPLNVLGASSGKVLVVGWGGTHGSILSAVENLQAQGKSVSFAHLRYIAPFQKELGPLLKQFDHVLVPELNTGQLVKVLRSTFMVNAIPFNKVQGRPFLVSEIQQRIEELL